MHVVIGATMDEKELTLELLRYLEGGGRLVPVGFSCGVRMKRSV